MPIDNLKFGVESLKNEYGKIATKRQHWNDTTVALLKSTFQKVTDAYDLSWNMEESNERQNAGIATLSFGKSDSGISEKTEFGLKHQEKFGGSLSFQQSYFGDIDIHINYPYLGVVPEEHRNVKHIMSVPPANVDEEFVYVQIGKLLTEVIAWEAGTSADKMG